MKMITKKYKVWLHLEEIFMDKNGKEKNYRSLDDEFLPLPAGEFTSREEAIKHMQNLSDMNNWLYVV